MLGSRPGTGLLTVPFNKFSRRDLGVHSPLLLERLPELASRKRGQRGGGAQCRSCVKGRLAEFVQVVLDQA